MFTKDIEKTIYALIKQNIEYANSGIFARPSCISPRYRYELHKLGIKVNEYDVTQNGLKVAKISYRYAARKVNGMYKILGAKLEYIQ